MVARGFCAQWLKNSLNFGWNKLLDRLGLRYFLVQLHRCTYWNGQVRKVQFTGSGGPLIFSTSLLSVLCIQDLP